MPLVTNICASAGSLIERIEKGILMLDKIDDYS